MARGNPVYDWPVQCTKATLALAILGVAAGHAAQAASQPVSQTSSIAWKGHTWQVTSGGMAGVCQGDPKNVSVDSEGFLHLRIANGGGTWTSAELFTTDRLGFGTYQWQVDGAIDTLDQNVVLGLFPYGPAAGIGNDGTNEIDIEYSRWGQANGPNGDWTDYPASGKTIGELSYTFSLSGMTLSTSRFTWSSSTITDWLLMGLQPVDGTTGMIKTWTYAPPMPSVNVPQQPLPLGMNLWCFDAPPSNGNPVEIVIRDFVFVAGGAAGSAGGAAGMGGGAAGGQPMGSGGDGGRPAGTGGARGGMNGSGGAVIATGGAGTGGRSAGTGGETTAPPEATGGASGGAGPTASPAGGTRSGCSCSAGQTENAASLGAFLLITTALTASLRRRRRD